MFRRLNRTGSVSIGITLRRIAVAGFLLCATDYAQAAPIRFSLPVRCIVGSSCFIQNYFDHDATAGYQDYYCGHLTYDGHTGTDFRLRDLAAMRTKVAVLAAAPGTVVGVRNTEPDISVKKRSKAALNGKDAGNGVRIDHGDGWATQYSHLLQGSVRVQAGQQVARGDLLGFVGLSGNTEFPHLDFSVSKAGKAVDPFNPEGAACGANPPTLWLPSDLPALHYQDTGVLIAGFSTTTPERDQAEDGRYAHTAIPDTAEMIFFWAELFGVRKNDRITTVLYGPDLRQLLIHEELVTGNKAIVFSTVGRRRGVTSWPKGVYSAVVRLLRDGKIHIVERRDVNVGTETIVQ